MSASNKNYDLEYLKWFIHDSTKTIKKSKFVRKYSLNHKYHFFNHDNFFDKNIAQTGSVFLPDSQEYFPSYKDTEVYIDRNKDRCTVIVGDEISYNSTTYEKNLEERLTNSIAKHCAEKLESDLYLSAVPNNDNFNSIFHLNQILNWLKSTKTYTKINVVFQLSSPHHCFDRDQRIHSDPDFFWYFIGGYKDEGNPAWEYDFTVSPQDYFALYEWACVDQLKHIVELYDNVRIGFWKYNYKVIDTNCVCHKSYLEFTNNIAVPFMPSVDWYDRHYDRLYILDQNQNFKQDDSLLAEQISKIDTPNKQINKDWSLYLLKNFGWLK